MIVKFYGKFSNLKNIALEENETALPVDVFMPPVPRPVSRNGKGATADLNKRQSYLGEAEQNK